MVSLPCELRTTHDAVHPSFRPLVHWTPAKLFREFKSLARITPSGNVAVARPQDTLRGSVTYEDDLMTPVVPVETWNATRGVLLAGDGRPGSSKRTRNVGG